MPEHTSVRRKTYTRPDHGLVTFVLAGHRYAAACTCGWEGEVHGSWADAGREGHEHRLAAHPFPWERVGETPLERPAD